MKVILGAVIASVQACCFAQDLERCDKVVGAFTMATESRINGMALPNLIAVVRSLRQGQGVPQNVAEAEIDLLTKGYQYHGSAQDLQAWRTQCIAEAGGQRAQAAQDNDSAQRQVNERARNDYFACLTTNTGPTATPADTIQKCRADPNYFRNRDAQRALNRETAPRYDCMNLGGGMVSCDPR